MVIDLSAIMKTILGINWRTTAAAIAPAVTSLGLIDKAIGDGQWPNSTDMAVITVSAIHGGEVVDRALGPKP